MYRGAWAGNKEFSQAGAGKMVKQEEEEIHCNYVQASFSGPLLKMCLNEQTWEPALCMDQYE